ncbi:MAG TPA: serine/threonine-protein kinase [Phycisphaerales bacterium]|nr:serine/threonine-protein kinase [Phycisphaerales bacterium]
MNRWERVEDVFHKVADLAPGEQTRVVADLCGEDGWTRARVMELVHADRGATSHSLAHIEASASRVRKEVETGAGPRPVPVRIAEFAVKARLGQGGFGTVYLAEQEHPVRRTVALKVIRPGFDTDLILARFEGERRTLALLDHPNIARMVSAGQTDDGLPYFSMEFVDGRAITTYCDEAKLSIPDRLRLFVGVCRAIHHAHQKGVVHRDIKPGNVLVTLVDGTPIAKVIDFGISKVLHATDEWGATLASVGQLIGTPEYMSPEQAKSGGQDVDTRSDVYALGVLLHELVTGVLPFDREELRKAGPVHACRMIAEMEPLSPTQRLRATRAGSAVHAAARGLESPASLERAVRGDLSVIIAKATAREPSRRYASAEDLAADVERFLRQEPILARGAGAAYRARKFLARNRVGVAAAVTAVLLAGSLIWGVQKSLSERRVLQQSAERAQSRAYDEMIASVARAENAIARGDEAAARTALTSVPGALRGWEWRVLRGMLNESRVLRTEQWTPLHMHINPAGTLVATGSYFQRVDVFRADTGGQVLTLGEVADPAWAPAGVAWSPDGVRLAAGVRDGVWIGDPLSPNSARILPIPGYPGSLAWSADGTRLACVRIRTNGRDGVSVIDARSGEVLAEGLAPFSHYVLLHPTRPVVFWGDIAGYLHGYDYAAQREVLKTRVCGDGINAIKLTPDGRRIAAASSCQVIAFYDVETLELVDKFNTPRAVIDIGFSPDGVWVYAASNTTLIDVFSLSTGSWAYAFSGGESATQALCVHPVSGEVYTGGPNSQIRVTQPRRDVFDLGIGPGGAMPVALAAGGIVLVQEDTRDADQTRTQGTYRVVDTRTARVVDTVPYALNMGWGSFAVGAPGDPHRFWHIRSGQLKLRSIGEQRDLCAMPIPSAIGLHGWRDSPHMVLTLWRGGWWVLDSTTGETLRDVRLHPSIAVESMSPDGKYVQCVEPLRDASTSREGDEVTVTYTIRDVQTGEVVSTLEPVAYGGYFAFSPDGATCACGYDSV